ncbi:MAG: phage integrase family protein [Polaromonas sp.]|nr:phage integrase family protein [Polaromonas sp.]
MTYRQNGGTYGGISYYRLKTYRQMDSMPLTDTFAKNIKPTGAPAGDKHTDGGGMYLLVNASGKYWRMNYRFADKRKTLALGAYPAVSLAKARATARQGARTAGGGYRPQPCQAPGKARHDSSRGKHLRTGSAGVPQEQGRLLVNRVCRQVAARP